MKKILFLICLISFIFITPISVLAEDTTGGQTPVAGVDEDGNMIKEISVDDIQIDFSFISELAGYKIMINDGTGNKVGEAVLDARGQGQIIVPANSPLSVSLSTDNPVSLGEAGKNQGISPLKMVEYLGLSIFITAIVIYFITRRRILKRFEGAFDLIRNDELDD